LRALRRFALIIEAHGRQRENRQLSSRQPWRLLATDIDSHLYSRSLSQEARSPFWWLSSPTAARDTTIGESCIDHPDDHTGLLSTRHAMLTSSILRPLHPPSLQVLGSILPMAIPTRSWDLRSSTCHDVPYFLGFAREQCGTRPLNDDLRSCSSKCTHISLKCENTMLWLNVPLAKPQQEALVVRHSTCTRLPCWARHVGWQCACFDAPEARW
jgi:hypothetical protein